MQWNGKEIKVSTITRKIVRDAQPILRRFETVTQKIQDSFIEHPEVLKAIQDGESETAAIFKSTELMQQFLKLQKEENESLDKLEATYDLFVLVVDYSGWTSEEVEKFKSSDNLDTLDKEEVYAFVASFRPRLSK